MNLLQKSRFAGIQDSGDRIQNSNPSERVKELIYNRTDDRETG